MTVAAATHSEIAVTVMVTSFRRPDRLVACVDGLKQQTRPADEVVVVIHSSDRETALVVSGLESEWPALRPAIVSENGSVAALNTGLAAASGAIVAIVDDDAVPASDWLERIVATYERDPRIAAVGGRDIVVHNGRVEQPPPRRLPGHPAGSGTVGRIQWFGRMVANHHLGVGPARDVDVLKGANMSVRRLAVIGHGYDERLRGPGVVMHSELSICLPLRRQGYRIVYDPAILVIHRPATRPHGDDREALSQVASASHNETLQILDHFGRLQRLVFAVWAVAIGTTEAPGVAVLVRDLIRRRSHAARRFTASQRGRIAAWRTRESPRAVPEPLRGPAPVIGTFSSGSQVRRF